MLHRCVSTHRGRSVRATLTPCCCCVGSNARRLLRNSSSRDVELRPAAPSVSTRWCSRATPPLISASYLTTGASAASGNARQAGRCWWVPRVTARRCGAGHPSRSKRAPRHWTAGQTPTQGSAKHGAPYCKSTLPCNMQHMQHATCTGNRQRCIGQRLVNVPSSTCRAAQTAPSPAAPVSGARGLALARQRGREQQGWLVLRGWRRRGGIDGVQLQRSHAPVLDAHRGMDAQQHRRQEYTTRAGMDDDNQ